MVAIFTGAGTGYERGSGNVLGGAGLLGTAALGRSGEQVMLNATNGNLMISQRDEFLVGRGPDATVDRTYNSLGDRSDDNGDNWRQGTQRQVRELTGTVNSWGSTVKRMSGDGSLITYAWNGAAYQTSDGAGAHDTLTYDGTWRWTDGDTRTVEVYGGPNNQISQLSDTSGNSLVYGYVGDRLSDITTSNGERIHYTWSGNDLVEISTVYNDGGTWRQLTRSRYEYDGYGRLATVMVDLTPNDNSIADGDRYVTSYTYVGSSNLLASITETDGTRLDIGYDGSGRIVSLTQTVAAGVARTTTIGYGRGYTAVTDPQGQVTTLYYDGVGRLTSIVSPPPASGQAAPSTAFAYDGSGDLIRVRDAAGAITRYGYDDRGNLIDRFDPDGTVTLRTYGAANQLLTETVDGNRVHYSAMQAGATGWEYGTDASGIRVGNVLETGFAGGAAFVRGRFNATAANQAVSLSTGGGDWFAVTGGERLAVQTGVEAQGATGRLSVVVHFLDAQGQYVGGAQVGAINGPTGYNTKVGGFVAVPAGAVRARLEVYGVSAGPGQGDFAMIEPTVTLASAGQTDLPSFGRTRAGTTSSTTRYAYDAANRLRFVVDAEGGVTEFVVGANGRTDWTRKQVAGAYDTSAWSCDTPLDYDTLVNWWGGADKTGAESIQYVYDDRLNLIQKVSFGWTNAGGNPLVSDGYTHEFFTYDQAGQLLERRTAGLNAETFVYDGLGRVKASTDKAGATTTIVFNDAATQTVVTLASGLVRTSTYDRAGELVTLTESGAYAQGGTTRCEYDSLGRVRKSTDANGIASYFLYDALGRKVADVNQYGWMSEYRYDGAGRGVASIRYALNVDGAQLARIADPAASPDIGAVRPAPHTYDIWSWTVYDAAGRAVEQIGGGGEVTTYDYDRSDRLVRTTGYTAKLGQAQLDAFKAQAPAGIVVPDVTGAQVARTFYDRDGRVAGTVDGEGWLTRITHDKAGRKVAETTFHNAADAGARADGTLDKLVAGVGAHPQDATTRYVYDGQGHLRFTIDALGRVTEHGYQYDTPAWNWGWSAYGPERVTTRYAGTIAALGGYTLDSVRQALSDAGLIGHARNRTSYAVYDDYNGAAGRLMYTVAADGAVTGYGYDVAGRPIRKTDYANMRVSDYLPSRSDLDAWAGNHASAGDRVERSYYNAAGELRFTVDAKGYVTRNDYDASGRLILTVRWSDAVAATDGWSIDTVAANQSGDTVSTNYAYDADGRVTRVTDGAGDIHDYQYYANGKLAWDILSNGQADESRTLFIYDGSGRVIVRAAAYYTAEQAVTSFVYDGRGNLVSTTDPDGRTTTRTYDKAGQLVSETAPTGATTTHRYDALGDQVQTTDARGNASYSYYDALGRLIATRDAEDYVTETSYTVFGDIAAVTRRANRSHTPASPDWSGVDTAPGDAVTLFDYDKLGRLVRTTDAEGYAESREYDAFGAVSRVTNKLGGITDYAYDPRGRLYYEYVHAPVYDATGEQTAPGYYRNLYRYDWRGNIAARYEGYGSSAQRLTTYVYDKADRLIARTLANVPVLAAGDHASVSAVGATERYAYDTRGNLMQTTDANGGRILSYYDDQDRKVAEITATGTVSQFFYDAVGNVTRRRVWGTAVGLPASPGGTVPGLPGGDYRDTVYTYDGLDRLLTTSVENVRTGQWTGSSFALALGTVTTSNLYDAMGNVIRVTDGNGVSTYAYYDRLGRKVRAVDGEGYITGWLYDAQGNVTHEHRWRDRALSADTGGWADPAMSGEDRITEFAYDRNGRRVAEYRYDVDAYAVDGNGSLRRDGGTAVIGYAYNGLGEVTSKTEATGETTIYNYGTDGRLFAETRAAYVDPDGNSVQPLLVYRYDALGNLVLTQQTAQGGGAGRTTQYRYDAAGRLASMQDAAGATTRYYYDAAGNLLRQSYQRTRAQDGGYLEGVLYTRDAAGRVTGQTIGQWQDGEQNAGAQGYWREGDRQDTDYNAYGEVARRGVNGGWQETFAYDGAGRLWRSNGGDGVWRYYVHDGAGRATMTLESAGSWLGAQSLDGALGLATAGFAYAPGAAYVEGINVTIGVYDRRGQQTGTLSPRRQLGEGGGLADLWRHRGYTAFGEVASETDALGHVTRYAYNTMGRLVCTTRPQVEVTGEDGVTAAATPVEEAYYDRSGRLVGRRDANGNVTRLGLLAGTGYGGEDALSAAPSAGLGGALVTAEWHADGGVVRRGYDRFGDLVRSTDEVGRVTAMAYDPLGRLVQVTRPGGGSESYRYDTLGQRVSRWTSSYGAGVVATTTYDAQGRVIGTRDLDGMETLTSYAWSGTAAASGLGAAGGAWTQTVTQANGRSASTQSDVFGHVVATSDLGGAQTLYGYDAAGREVSRQRQGGMGEGVTTAWLNTGRAARVTSDAGSVARYGYDAGGRRVSERYALGGVSYQDASATYDALGRMTSWREAGSAATPGASMGWRYDAAGNVRMTSASRVLVDAQGSGGAMAAEGERWYRYDSMNRVVTDGGRLAGGLAGGRIERGGGSDYTYDAAGERMSATRGVTLTGEVYVWDPQAGGDEAIAPRAAGASGQAPSAGSGQPDARPIGGGGYVWRHVTYAGERRESYGYTADGALSRVTIAATGYADDGAGHAVSTGVFDRYGGGARFEYDGLGRQVRQVDTDANGQTVLDRQASHAAGGPLLGESVYQRQGSDTLTSTTAYDYGAGYGAAGSAASGQAVRVSVASSRNGQAQGTSVTANAYLWGEGALLAQSSVTGSASGSSASTTTYGYGAGGRLASVAIQDGRPRTVRYVSDLSGAVVRRDEADGVSGQGDPHDVWYRYGGVGIGHVGNNGAGLADYAGSIDRRATAAGTAPFANPDVHDDGRFAASVDRVTSYDQGSEAGTYTVRGGDTLAGIAAALWGDSALWYKLAAANGLGGDAALAAGRVLTIPAGVIRSTYSAATFAPYDPAATLGDLGPVSPQPAASAARKNRCGAFGTILLVAVAVAVSAVATGGVLALAAGQPLSAGLATIGLGSGTAITSVGAGGFAAAGAVGGAVGSLASQGVGVATGLQEGFDWKGVALAGLSGGVGGGLGAAGLGKIGGSALLGAVVRGAAGNLATQGLALATGLQSKFDWTGVATGAAVGLGVGLGRFAGLGQAGDRLAGGLAGALAGAGARSLLTGTDFGDNVLAALPDVIGQTIGEMVAGRIAGGGGTAAITRTLARPTLATDASGPLSALDTAYTTPDLGGGNDIVVTARGGGAASEAADVALIVNTQSKERQEGGAAGALVFPTTDVGWAANRSDLDRRYATFRSARADAEAKGLAFDYSGPEAAFAENYRRIGVAGVAVAGDLAQFDSDVRSAMAFPVVTAATAAFEPLNIAYTAYQYARSRIDTAEAAVSLVPGAAALGRSAKGLRVVEEETVVEAVHKNSLSYVGDTHVYVIKGPDGSLYKVGESAQGVRVGDGASIRAEQQARALRKETGDIYDTEIRKNLNGKADARAYETKFIQTYERLYGKRPPGNMLNR